MLRSLWTAASGMTAQQLNVDTIANNLANVNTIGYKTETAEFKSLLYQTLQTKTTSANGENKPVSAQVGLGVRNTAITSNYKQGSYVESSSNFSFAINGAGFFGVQENDGTTAYTRSGNFYLSQGSSGMVLCTSEGYPVLDSTGEPIVLDSAMEASKITVDADGNFCYPDASGNAAKIGVKIGLFQFSNAAGLTKNSSSLLLESDASGVPINEDENTDIKKSAIKQGYVEGSNVDVAIEMVNLITAQRAYELNSKAIQAADDMLSQANNLRR